MTQYYQDVNSQICLKIQSNPHKNPSGFMNRIWQPDYKIHMEWNAKDLE